MPSPEAPAPGATRQEQRWEAGELVSERVAMATRCAVRLVPPDGAEPSRIEAAAAEALAIFAEVEAACTRFCADSPLMRANQAPDRWQRVPRILLEAVEEAKRAHDRTGGRVDPRVLGALVDLGYDRTLPFGREAVRLARAGLRAGPRRPGRGGAFRPGIRRAAGEVRLGPEPIDLGGIGKGLAVRWADQSLMAVAPDHLVDAGGDCACRGGPPGGGPWLVGVEDPSPCGEQGGPVAVLGLRDRAVATSSVRLRRWTANGRPVHHLIDPRTGRPGGEGLLAVTVVGEDPAVAESWSKALFLAGRRQIGSLARRRGLAALWVEEDGKVSTTGQIERYLRWRRA